jgi:hypothetical protein
MRDISDLVGTFYSKKWVQRNVLQLNDDEIEEMQKEIEEERKSDPNIQQEPMSNDQESLPSENQSQF